MKLKPQSQVILAERIPLHMVNIKNGKAKYLNQTILPFLFF